MIKERRLSPLVVKEITSCFNDTVVNPLNKVVESRQNSK